MMIELNEEEIKLIIDAIDRSLPSTVYLNNPSFLLQLRLKVLLNK